MLSNIRRDEEEPLPEDDARAVPIRLLDFESNIESKLLVLRSNSRAELVVAGRCLLLVECGDGGWCSGVAIFILETIAVIFPVSANKRRRCSKSKNAGGFRSNCERPPVLSIGAVFLKPTFIIW